MATAVSKRMTFGFGIVFAIVNLIFGTDIADRLIYHGGVAGSAIITASRATAKQYNNRTVTRA